MSSVKSSSDQAEAPGAQAGPPAEPTAEPPAEPWDRPARAAFAVRPSASRGRLYAEDESAHRSAFQRDRDRILHSEAFRRLKHKTQVFVEHEGDYYRTRLTHSLEVAQIARTVARALGLEEDLAEAVSLAHDLGHTPFGHAGETMLDALMTEQGGFDHNSQALRVVTELERRYASFDGLNLTWETLEGLVKHNGPLVGPLAGVGVPATLGYGIAAYCGRHDLELETFASAEAQVAALADDVAYNNHDIDDGLRAGLFDFDEIAAISLVGDAAAETRRLYPALERERFVFETLRRVFGAMVDDLLGETRRRLTELDPRSAADVRAAREPVAAFSAGMLDEVTALRRFLFSRMYRHSKVNRMMSKAKRVVRELFELFMQEPKVLPDPWRSEAERADGPARARLVADYIAGMTDRYALDEHRQLFDPFAAV